MDSSIFHSLFLAMILNFVFLGRWGGEGVVMVEMVAENEMTILLRLQILCLFSSWMEGV